MKVWAHTAKKLEEKHPSSVENLSNSSLYFRNLTLSKRVLFLFPQVLKLIGPEFANQKNTKVEGSNITKCRMLSKSWRKTVDQFIGIPEPDFFETSPPQPSDHALVNARCQYFGYKKPVKLPEFVEHFQDTHLPHSSRNPFIGQVVFIDLTGFKDRTEWVSIVDQVSTLLRKYGHHIKVLNLGLFEYDNDPNIQLQKHSWLLEWLENCPNLTHLKVSERFSLNDNLDVAFGTRPDPERFARLQGLGLDQLDSNWATTARQLNDITQRLQCDYRLDDRQSQNNALSQELNIIRGLGANFYYHARPAARPVQLPPVPPFPTLKNLQCIKLCNLSALNFNSLISANTQVVWLQIEPLRIEHKMYINYLALEMPNLKKLYIKCCSQEHVRKFMDIHQSWLSLTHLHFEYCMSELCSFSHKFMDWIEIFEVISRNWGNALTELKLRLPMARKIKEKEKVARDSGNCRLNLPNLKRLRIWLSEEAGGRVAKTDFLDLLRVKLEELIVE